MIEKYYYLRSDYTKTPRLTTCIIQNEAGEIALGRAICSFSDFPNKKIGRAIARGRALKALDLKNDYAPIKRMEGRAVVRSCNANYMTHKAQYMPVLLPSERKMLKRGEEV